MSACARYIAPMLASTLIVLVAAVDPNVIVESRVAMGTRVTLQVVATDEADAKRAIDAAFGEIARVEQLISEWLPDSEVSRINSAAGQSAVQVTPETLSLIQAGVATAKASNGAFALTWAALRGVWTFEGGAKVPEKHALDARLPLVGDHLIAIDAAKGTVRLAKPGMALGVGGIGKGFAADKALAVLASRGYTNVLVAASGDIVARGRRGARPWVIGIQDPRAPGYFATLTLEDQAISTSGDYEKYFEKDGVRYHHLIDPRTGQPARGARSVTLVAPDGVTADAYATAVFVLGPVEGMKLVENDPRLGAVIVDEKNEVLVSSSLASRVRTVRPPTL